MPSPSAKPSPDQALPSQASPLDQPLRTAVGGRTASALTKHLGVRTVGDLLAHYPRRYARRGELTAVAGLTPDEHVTIVAQVVDVRERPMRQRRGSIVEARISDGKGALSLTFFNQRWRMNELRPGSRGIFAGRVTEYRGTLQLAHPDYELFEDDGGADPERAQAWAQLPIPIYPATATVPSWKIAQAVGVVLDTLPPGAPAGSGEAAGGPGAASSGPPAAGALGDPVPEALRTARGLLPYREALELIHRPQRDDDWQRARETLRFQEAFVLQAALLQQRERLRAVPATAREPGPLLAGFDAALPFQLTDDQRAVGEQVAADLAAPVPMNRLVQGEVGSGKTLVALRAMLAVAQSGGQSALLAPTEVLAHQHLRSIVRTLGPDLAAKLRPTLLTGGLPAAQKRKATLAAVSGAASIVVGTHALLSGNVEFFDLGLVVVDEQHRFGVDQREALRLKGTNPHVLVLTATPIPRTVAMTVFGDLDISSIAQLPAGRPGITSHAVPLAERPGWIARVWERLAEELEQGRQGFVVCPAIDPGVPEDDPDALVDDAGAAARGAAGDGDTGGGDTGGRETSANVDDGGPARAAANGAAVANVTATLAALRADERFAGKRIEALHGRLPADEKDAVMREFADGAIDVLVATTVIEVGVDVPNASTMVVLDADRFGVSQLHQLRGRVGRGSVPGLCLFVTAAAEGTIARQRVDAVAATLDGFELAQVDLDLRQEGDVLGDVQSGGRSSLKLVRVARDGELIAAAREAAAELLAGDPELAAHPSLATAIARRLDATAEAYLAKG